MPEPESDNERKPFNCQTANSSRQHHAPRDRKSENDETKQNAKASRVLQCGGKGHPARLCPSPMIATTWTKLETESPSDADSDPFDLH